MNSEIQKWLPNNKAAILWNGEKYDYNYIHNRIACIANELQKRVGSGNNIGIYMKRCPDVIFAMIASIVSGNVYVPIDTMMPKDRMDYIFENAEVKCVVTTSEYEDVFDGKNIILAERIEENHFEEIEPFHNDDAYIIYTSGSTGLPKGVCVSKRNLFSFMRGICEKIDFKEGTSIACITSYSFDIFFLESILALHKGLEVCFANEHQKNNPIAGLKYLIENEITMLQLTPSRIQQYINYDSKMDFLKNVNTLMIGGEKMPIGLLRKLQESSNCRIYNMYGPTETTIWATIGDVTDSQEVHAGDPLMDTELCIIDENMNVCSYDTKGELCISGSLLSKGYYNNDELTRKKFITLGDRRMYRTGDIASISGDNKLYIFGRTDNQVKIHGYRIELEEIENAIRNTGILSDVVVLAAKMNENGDKRLVAFYIDEDNAFDVEHLKNTLKRNLPMYMIPEQFYKMEEFPLTVSGKVDRNKVIIKYLHMQKNIDIISQTDEELNEVEKKIIDIIQKSIEDKNIRINKESDLGAIGVDSVSFVKIIVDIECEFGVEFDVEEVFDSQTKLKTVGEWIDFTKRIIEN